MSSFQTFIVAYIVSLIAGIIGIIIICRIWIYVLNYRMQNNEIIRVIPYDNDIESNICNTQNIMNYNNIEFKEINEETKEINEEMKREPEEVF
jgi:MinD superfamily P-loop ATPase